MTRAEATSRGSPRSDFTQLPDLAGRALGGAVVAADDEFFAAKENLILPHPPVARHEFGHRGKEYDGWETRRRRSPGVDRAVLRLGAPGIVAGVVLQEQLGERRIETGALGHLGVAFEVGSGGQAAGDDLHGNHRTVADERAALPHAAHIVRWNAGVLE